MYEGKIVIYSLPSEIKPPRLDKSRASDKWVIKMFLRTYECVANFMHIGTHIAFISESL